MRGPEILRRRRSRPVWAQKPVEVLEQRVLLADGITAKGAAQINGTSGVALSNVTVASFVVSDPSGSPGTKWRAHIDWGDNSSPDKKVSPTAQPDGSFIFQGTHTYAAPGTYTITVMIAVPGTHTSQDNIVKTTAVISAALQSITVTPANPSVPKGLTQQFTATATYSDNTTKDVTTSVTWASATTSVATITSAGLATAVAQGTSKISATLSGITGSTTMTVTAPVLTSLALTPVNPNVPKGETQQFKATGTFSDNSTQDVTSQAAWSSATTSVATIDSAGLATAVAEGTSKITATISGISDSTTMTVTPAALLTISVTPANPSVPKGETQQFTATGNYSDKTTKDLTGQATWASATTSVATIDSNGLATAVAAGTSKISATFSGVTGSTTMTVAAAALVSIAVTPANPSVPKGETQQFTATGTFSDGSTKDVTSQATWSSDTTSVATINASGLASAVAQGTAKISATIGNISGSTTMTVAPAALVSIAVTPANPSVPKGGTQQFTATGTFSDNSTSDVTSQVTWTSATTAVATINASGLATAVSEGTSKISATLGSVSGSTTLTVTPALVSIAVTPANPIVPKGETQQFTATATFSDNSTKDVSSQVTWASDTTSVATINASGLATAVGVGTSKISATLNGITGSTTLTVTPAVLTSIAVTPANPSVPKGATKQFTATGTYSDKSTQDITAQVTWASGTTSVATVDKGGLATAVAEGTSTISATLGNLSGSTTLTVIPAALVSIDVTPANPSVPKGETQQFTATGTYTDQTTKDLSSQVTWASATTSVATISTSGLATAVTEGTSTISATFGGLTGSTTLTVSPAALLSIAVTPANPSLPKGSTLQFTATGTFSDKSTKDISSQVTWASATTSVATISATGLATGVADGASSISAALNGVTGSTTLTVTPALVSIAVTPANPSLPKGQTQQFTATATFSDNSTRDISSQVTWNSATTSVATINASGLATGVSQGTSTISATFNGISGSTTLTVSPASLLSITVTPANPSIPKGETKQFTATGKFSDNSTQDVTAQVTWASGTTSVATISAAGLATGVGQGTSTITATLNGVNGSTSLTVTPAVVVSIAVTPANPSVPKGETKPLTATATLSDNSTSDVTSQVTWTSATTSVATINASGVAKGVAQGTSKITAALNGISGSTTLTVSPAALLSIAVTPANPTVPQGASKQLTATGTFSDNTTQNLTSQVTWASATPSVATISPTGSATGVTQGTSTITATLNGISGSTTLTVGALALVSIAITPASPSIQSGATQQFTATGTFSDKSTQDLTNQVTWSSTNPQVATIDPSGLATGVAQGQSTIKATLNGVTGTTRLTISPPSLVSIQVTVPNASLPKGESEQAKALGTFSDGSTQDITRQVDWTSVTSSVATINGAGLATGVGQGTDTIDATLNGVTGFTTLTINAPVLLSITVSPTSAHFTKGSTQQFTATATLSDHSTRDVTNQVTWVSSNPAVATISSTGLARGLAQGTSTIRASVNGVSSAANASVGSGTLLSVTSVQRFGFHEQPTTLVLSFNEPLDPVRAQNPGNYQIVTLGGRGRGGARVGRVIAISRAVYNPTTMTVTLFPVERLDVHNFYRLTVNGTSPNGVSDAQGNLLAGNGNAGSNFVTVISMKSLAGPNPFVFKSNVGGRGGLVVLRRR